MVQKLGHFCWNGEFCMFLDLHHKGPSINQHQGIKPVINNCHLERKKSLMPTKFYYNMLFSATISLKSKKLLLAAQYPNLMIPISQLRLTYYSYLQLFSNFPAYPASCLVWITRWRHTQLLVPISFLPAYRFPNQETKKDDKA